jgi:hypothetical protein
VRRQCLNILPAFLWIYPTNCKTSDSLAVWGSPPWKWKAEDKKLYEREEEWVGGAAPFVGGGPTFLGLVEKAVLVLLARDRSGFVVCLCSSPEEWRVLVPLPATVSHSLPPDSTTAVKDSRDQIDRAARKVIRSFREASLRV